MARTQKPDVVFVLLTFALHLLGVFLAIRLGLGHHEISEPPRVVTALLNLDTSRNNEATPLAAPTSAPHLIRPVKVTLPEPRFPISFPADSAAPPAPVPVGAITAPTPSETTPPSQQSARADADYYTNPAPAYPLASRLRREQGVVYLRVHVDATGSVVGVDLHESSGYPALDRAASMAVWKWKFRAARREGRAIADIVIVPVSFHLR